MDHDYNKHVEAQVEKLTTLSLAEIQARAARKRLAWLDERFHGSSPARPVTPRRAFELLFFEYMGLDPRSLEVTTDNEDEIAWVSRNLCLTLGACAALGLDTRTVCRGAYEKSTQAFLSRPDPELRFLRSYERIRPYADGCWESIVRVDFAAMIETARKLGDLGHGALVSMGRRILAQAGDAEPLGVDPSNHAETQVLLEAALALGDANLSGAILFASSRPCPACLRLAKQANLTAVVFQASELSAQPDAYEIIEYL
jgi:tRNA(Arg) A34 adenosine deaminase TadA